MDVVSKQTSVVYDEKRAFLRFYDRIIDAQENYAFTEKEARIQSILTDAILDETISVSSFVSLVVTAYAE